MSKSNITSLSEFLEARGFSKDDPAEWARCFYKYTDCGPWVVFLVQKTPERVERHLIEVTFDSKRRRIRARAIEDSYGFAPPEILERFGFDSQGLPAIADAFMRSIDEYEKQLQQFQQELSGDSSLSFELRKTSGQALHRTALTIDVQRRIPAEILDIPSRFLRNDPPAKVDNANCVGIMFGSIVEGSDYEAGPWTFTFPFKMAQFNAAEKEMDKETSFYWERDNSQWYKLRAKSRPEDIYFLHNTWGEIRWDVRPKSRKIAAAADAFVKQASLPNYEWHPLPGGDGWEVAEYPNDNTL